MTSKLSELEARLASIKERARGKLSERADALEEAASQLAGGDATAVDAILRAAHKLHGLGGTIDRLDLSERAGRLESAIRSGATHLAVIEGAKRLARVARTEPSAAAPASPRTPAERRPARAKVDWRVLVVDDEASTLQLLTLALKASGCRVKGMTEPEALIRLAAEEPADLAIVDAMMPTMNGLEVYTALRAIDGPAIPVVILSAASVEDLHWTLPKDPRLTWMRKPFRAGALLRELRAFVDGARTPPPE